MTENQSQLLGEINERTKLILDRLPTFATNERVDSVSNKLDEHISSGRLTFGNILAIIMSVSGLGTAIAAFLYKGK